MAQKTSFSCGESLDITRVNQLHERLLKALEKSSTIEVKADKVSKADTAGLQLLVATINQLQRSHGELVWKNPSDALLTAAKQLGLSEQLRLSTH